MLVDGGALTAIVVAFACVVVALHLAIRRRHTRRVAWLKLYDDAADVRRGRFALRASASEWRSLAASLGFVGATGLAAWLASSHTGLSATRLVFIAVDTSTSMRATDVAPNRLGAAEAVADSWVGQITDDDRAIIIGVGGRVVPYSRLETDRGVLRAAVHGIESSDSPLDCRALTAFVSAALGGAARRELWLVTDGALPMAQACTNDLARNQVTLRVRLVGRAHSDNISVRNLTVRNEALHSSNAEAIATISNGSSRAAHGRVVLARNDAPFDFVALDLPAHARERMVHRIPALDGTLSARFVRDDAGHDALASDDVSRVGTRGATPLVVAIVGDENRYLEAALALDPALTIHHTDRTEVTRTVADVVILDGIAPSAPLHEPTLWLGPPADARACPVEVAEAIERPFFETVDRSHRLLRFTDLADVNITRAALLRPRGGDAVLAADARTPLLVTGERQGQRFVVLGFDVRQSDLPLRAAWPIFVLDTVRWLAGDAASNDGGSLRQVAASLATSLALDEPASLEAEPALRRVATTASAPDLAPPLSTWLYAASAAMLLLVLCWAIAFPRPSMLSRLERTASLALRAFAALALCAALVNPKTATSARREHTTIALDVSRSIPPARLAATTAGLARMEEAPSHPATSYVTFAGTPRVETALPAISAQQARTDLDATDLARALSLSALLAPTDTDSRIVLVSDGNETTGDARASARALRRLGLTIGVVDAPHETARLLTIVDLDAPTAVGQSASFRVRGSVRASRDARARLALFLDASPAPIASELVELTSRATAYDFSVPAAPLGDHVLTLRLTPVSAADEAAEDHLERPFIVVSPPRALIVAEQSSHVDALRRALDVASFATLVVRPSALDASSFDRTAFAVLSDVPANALRQPVMQSLVGYVRSGGALLVSGGDHAFGSGGYRGTPLEGLLPVRLDAPEEHDVSNVALELVIDTSGSMTGQKIELAKAAARSTAEHLADADWLGVIGFADGAEHIARLRPATDRARIASEISRLAPGGGTNIGPALEMAHEELLAARARTRHVVLLTDGQTDEANVAPLVAAMHADGITLSAVGLGPDVQRTLLETLARRGGGRSYFTDDPHAVPRIFIREADFVRGSSVVDATVRAVVHSRTSWLDGIPIADAPPLLGVVATTARQAPAETLLTTNTGAPLLARWHIGLGWVLAWTSNLEDRWATRWLAWSHFEPFVTGLAHAHASSEEDRELPVEVALHGDDVLVLADAPAQDDGFDDDATVTAAITHLTTGGAHTAVADGSLELVAPGRYGARLPLGTTTGAFLAHVVLEHEDGSRFEGHAAFGRARTAELANRGPSRATLAAIATASGGIVASDLDSAARAPIARRARRVALAPALLLVALALFVVELAVRKLARLSDARRGV